MEPVLISLAYRRALGCPSLKVLDPLYCEGTPSERNGAAACSEVLAF